MWPDDEDSTMPSPASAGGWKWGTWRIPSDHLALLVGAFCGGALVLVLLAGVIAWRCCILPRRHKSYCTRITEEIASRQRTGLPVLHSHSAVYADPKKGNWGYNSRLVSTAHSASLMPLQPGTHWFYNSRVLSPAYLERLEPGPISRSSSYVHEHHRLASPADRRRPLSQPIRFGPCDLTSSQEQRHCKHLPEISEFSPQPALFASSSISFILTVLDDTRDREEDLSRGAILKTRSLPAWVRSRPRPLSTEDNISNLYAKVNFSKKRKNRMRNDEAAIIAMSKSRSQFLHKDTDSLVDNEAVIVYNERTAL